MARDGSAFSAPASRRSRVLAPAVLLALSCGGGENAGTPTTPTAPRPSDRQLTGFEVAPGRTAIRVGQVVEPLAYGRYDDGATGTVEAAWTSSDPAVIQVGEDATITGVAVGRAQLSAAFEDFSETVDFIVELPNPRYTQDQPDDIPGPQIHVVYAVPGDGEDGNLDRYGDIARSFEAIQLWLGETLGYRLRLDTYGGDLDVTFVQLPLAPEEGDPQGGDLISALGDAVAGEIGYSPGKIYAIYYAGRVAGICGSARIGGSYGAVYVDREGCSSASPGPDPDVVSTYEAVMVHQLLHVFGAVSACDPDQEGGSHVHDDAQDVMYAGAELPPHAEPVFDVERDDYFGHGRADCLDVGNGPFWEPVGGGRANSGEGGSTRVQIPVADWPVRCGLR